MRKLLLLLTAAVLSVPCINAQVTSYTVNPVNCGVTNPNYYCPPFTVASGGTNHSVFYEPFYNNKLHILDFKGLNGLGKAVVNLITTSFDGTYYHQVVNFQGLDASQQEYFGTSSITFTTYYSGGGGGRGCGGCGTRWVIHNGNVNIDYVTY